MVKTKDLPKTYEKSVEELEEEIKEIKKEIKKIDENLKTEKFVEVEQVCVICKTQLIEHFKKELEPWHEYANFNRKLYFYSQGIHCPNCGLKYSFARPPPDTSSE